jgi:NtrC-family two-component system response regulator AlgB
VRIVAATNRDLKKRVAEGAFREDLYYRLNVIAVRMPSLRERPEDLMRFALHYLKHFSKATGRIGLTLSEDAEAAIKNYPWPGNLRELRNAIERAVILCACSNITAADLPSEFRGDTSAAPGIQGVDAIVPGSSVTVEVLEEIHIKRILERTESMVDAARILGIDQATLYRKRKKMGL